MLNFANLFNQFRSQANNGISDLLQQATVKMGRLLDEDSFMNEYKSANPRVVEFMKYKRFQELIEFVTVVGPADDKKRSYKYPLSACDLLSVDNNTAIEYFFPERPLTVDEKVVEEIEVQVETEVEQSPQTPKETVPDSPPKTEQSTVQPEKVQQNQAEKTPEEQNAAAAEKTSEPQIELLVQSIEKDKTLEEKAEPLTPEKKMKKVITLEKRKVQKIIKRQVEPLISKLMAYFDQNVNYTLAGYVSKIVSVFFVKRPAVVMKYMLEEAVVEKVLNHAESRSVGELIIKMLTNETTLCLEMRRDFFKAILKRMSVSSEIYIMSNISAYICEIIEKIATNLKGNNKINEFNTVFFSLDVIQQVIRNVMSGDENISVYNAPILFTYLTNVPFILPEDESIVEEFKKLLEHFIEKSCEKLEVTYQSRPKLGTGRVKIIQILRFILKENVLNSKQIIGNKEGFFRIVISLMKQYQMNNMLHNELMKIIEIALSEKEGSALNNAVVRDNILITLISEEATEDKKIKAGKSVYQHRKGYIAHIINLAIKLKELSESNQNIKRAIESPQFTDAYEAFIEKEIVKNRKSLAGFSLRKDLKHEIMFQREEIIAAYANFLQRCPGPVFQKSAIQEPINIEHPDLVEQLQKQLEQNLTVKNKEEIILEKIEKEPEPESTIKTDDSPEQSSPLAEEPTPTNYWSPYLEYNIDDLMVDL